MDKRRRSDLFRQRLAEAMTQKGMNRSDLARATGVNRSTVSQVLADGETRLPGAQMVAESAAALGVSADWLLGLSDRPELITDLMASSLAVTAAQRALLDEQVAAWHREAEGYKIRHVPATLPDLLKTQEVLAWEYESHLGRTAQQAAGTIAEGADWLREARSDYEIALPRHELESFCRAEGYYRGLPADIRRAQIDHIARSYDRAYPTLRIFVFDARRVFSAPVTVFGPRLAVIYLGLHYVAFRDRERVRDLTSHFDWLVRETQVNADRFAGLLRTLREEIA